MPLETKPSFFQRPIAYFAGFVVFLLMLLLVLLYANKATKPYTIVKQTKSSIKKTKKELKDLSEHAHNILEGPAEEFWPLLERLVDKHDLVIQVFKNDSIIFWNSNKVALLYPDSNQAEFQVSENEKGWYTVYYSRKDDLHIILYRLLKSSFNNKDQHFTTRLFTDMIDCKNLHFTSDRNQSEFEVLDENNQFLVGIYFVGNGIVNEHFLLIIFSAFLVTYISLLVWITSLYYYFERFIGNKLLVFLFLLTDFTIIRLIEYYSGFPVLLKQSFLFDQQFDLLYLFNSPADLLINAIIVILVSIQFVNIYKPSFSINILKSNYLSFLLTVVLTILAYLVFGLTFHVIRCLPSETFYGFLISDTSVAVGLLAVFGFQVAYYLIFNVISQVVQTNIYELLKQILVVVIIGLIFFFFADVESGIVIVSTLFLTLLYIAHFLLSAGRKNTFYLYLSTIIIFASSFSIIVNQARIQNKSDHQLITLDALSQLNDPEFEEAYISELEPLNEDTIVLNYLTNNTLEIRTGLYDYMMNNYLNTFSKKFDIQLTICQDDEMIELKPENILLDCAAFFKGLIDDSTTTSISENLFHVDESPGNLYYLGHEELIYQEDTTHLFIEFFFTYMPEGLGYSEFLIRNLEQKIDLSAYSFATYRNDQLITKFGNYQYLTSFVGMRNYPDNEVFKLNDCSHIKRKLNENSYLVISRNNERLSTNLVTFSGLFVIYVVIVFLVVIILFGRQALVQIQTSFQSRLQMVFLMTISLIIIMLAVITLFYVNLNNQNQIIAQLSEKTNSVIIELQHKMSEQEVFSDSDPEELEYLLRKFSLVFFSDINVYSPSGKLISSSRPKIFEHELLSEMVNPMAYEEIFVKNQLFYINREEIGRTSYFSSYAPIMLTGNKPAGIVNLPYFAKQTEVNRSYYLMIFTFINFFVFLGILGSLVAVLLSRLVTRPITVLKENLAALQIDKRNKVIEWHGKDEIGKLITAYNEMIEKLDESAELLKKSERESAWREVARQIAHEIKNPLTPMKLNIQYLEKAYQENDPELDKKVKNISKLLINQIETLNKVAEMFSDFAKTKRVNLTKVNLNKVIHESVSLYRNHPKIDIELKIENEEDIFTRAFEKDLSRLFTNLIKNAVQSIEENKKGLLLIETTSSTEYHKIIITDNGKGIPDEAKENIFQPYFTTKSKGTGLGLAIVKNIMNEIGGEITFESKAGKGTTFYLEFPVFDQ